MARKRLPPNDPREWLNRARSNLRGLRSLWRARTWKTSASTPSRQRKRRSRRSSWHTVSRFHLSTTWDGSGSTRPEWNSRAQVCHRLRSPNPLCRQQAVSRPVCADYELRAPPAVRTATAVLRRATPRRPSLPLRLFAWTLPCVPGTSRFRHPDTMLSCPPLSKTTTSHPNTPAWRWSPRCGSICRASRGRRCGDWWKTATCRSTATCVSTKAESCNRATS